MNVQAHVKVKLLVKKSLVMDVNSVLIKSKRAHTHTHVSQLIASLGRAYVEMQGVIVRNSVAGSPCNTGIMNVQAHVLITLVKYYANSYFPKHPHTQTHRTQTHTQHTHAQT